MDPIIINIKNCDKNMDAIIIKVKKCDKNMEEGSDHDILICEKCPETFNSLKSLESHRKKSIQKRNLFASLVAMSYLVVRTITTTLESIRNFEF